MIKLNSDLLINIFKTSIILCLFFWTGAATVFKASPNCVSSVRNVTQIIPSQSGELNCNANHAKNPQLKEQLGQNSNDQSSKEKNSRSDSDGFKHVFPLLFRAAQEESTEVKLKKLKAE